MNALRLYKIQDKYIRFLAGADHRVQHNKCAKRPYVGIVLTVGSFRYFVPMESPKENHKNLKTSVHIMPLDRGRLGQLGFNNMIPVPKSAMIEFEIAEETDEKYAELLKRQVSYINSRKAEVMNRASKTYFRATSKGLSQENFFKKTCCDFKKLEQMCLNYNPDYAPKRKRK